MAKYKTAIKAIVPPLIFSLLRRFQFKPTAEDIWSGDFESWHQAASHCTGYDSEVILEKCKGALLKVKNGDAVYERDSVLFTEKHYSWGILAGLQKAALENDGTLSVLDFGGSLGSTYYQNKGFLTGLKKISWSIIEQANFVKCGKHEFEDTQLRFYNSLEECLLEQKPNVLLLSSVLQYLPTPKEWIDNFLRLEVPYIIIDRTSFFDGERDLLTIQRVPEIIYKASYPCWFFNENGFLNSLSHHYSLIAHFDSYADHNMTTQDGRNFYWKGFILKRIN